MMVLHDGVVQIACGGAGFFGGGVRLRLKSTLCLWIPGVRLCLLLHCIVLRILRIG